MDRLISAAVIGAGWAATKRHVPAYVADPRTRMAGICDPVDPAAAHRVAAANEAHVYTSLDELLESDVDLVSICTPPTSHAEICERVLSAGKHVLVEKPMVITTEEAESLVELAAEKGLTLCPCHNLLFVPPVLEAQEMLASAGEIYSALALQWNERGIRTAAWSQQIPHGHFIEDAPHGLYLLQKFMGELRVDHARRRAARVGPGTEMEWVRVDLDAAARSATLIVGSGSPVRLWAVTLVCANAVVVIDLVRNLVVRLPATDSVRRARSGSVDVAVQITRWAWERARKRRRAKGHETLISRLVESIRSGSSPPVSAAEGAKTVALAQEAVSRLS